MKVLFYLEPHPIRERYESFSWIGKEVCKMLQDKYVHTQFNKKKTLLDMRIMTSRHYAPLMKEFPKIRKAFIGLTSKENDSLSYFYDDWNQQSIAIWKELMHGEGEVSKFYNDILSRVKNNVFDFDVIIYWSTNGAVKKFALDHNVQSISMELGCTRIPFFESVYMDFLGVNGNAITRKLDIKLLPDCDIDEIIENLPFNLAGNKGKDGKHNVLKTSFIEEIYKNPLKNILIPMQLDDDSNILMFSKYANMLEFLEEVLPPLINKGYRCFIKPHPGAKSRKLTELGHKTCEDYCSDLKNVFWVDDIDNKRDYLSLLNKMTAVVTVNSSVGFEALLLKKVVVTMGDGAYSINSLPTLTQLVDGTINLKEYYINIGKIANVMLYNYLLPKEYVFEQNFFVEYLLRQIRLNNAYLTLNNRDFTHYFLKEENNMKNYFILYDSDQSFLTQYQQRIVSKQNTVPIENIEKRTSLSQKHIRNRKMKKLFDSPVLFFSDAIKNILKK
ncbi:hypothetical protein [Sulfurimonas sp.]|uniref:capsular polysaccharide export protein, LipB/KpsS family n=1 Tax=Sulfurimonas sp. TaxID=2022749 RepID=UPI0026262D6C|nr:hypothetical protein [Sulfurimonas sp.]